MYACCNDDSFCWKTLSSFWMTNVYDFLGKTRWIIYCVVLSRISGRFIMQARCRAALCFLESNPCLLTFQWGLQIHSLEWPEQVLHRWNQMPHCSEIQWACGHFQPGSPSNCYMVTCTWWLYWLNCLGLNPVVLSLKNFEISAGPSLSVRWRKRSKSSARNQCLPTSFTKAIQLICAVDGVLFFLSLCALLLFLICNKMWTFSNFSPCLCLVLLLFYIRRFFLVNFHIALFSYKMC